MRPCSPPRNTRGPLLANAFIPAPLFSLHRRPDKCKDELLAHAGQGAVQRECVCASVRLFKCVQGGGGQGRGRRGGLKKEGSPLLFFILGTSAREGPRRRNKEPRSAAHVKLSEFSCCCCSCCRRCCRPLGSRRSSISQIVKPQKPTTSLFEKCPCTPTVGTLYQKLSQLTRCRVSLPVRVCVRACGHVFVHKQSGADCF